MKTTLTKLTYSKYILKDKRGFSLIETFFYVVILVFLTMLIMNSATNLMTIFISEKSKEMFYSQKDQVYTLLYQDLADLNYSSLEVIPSNSYPDTNKLVFDNSTYKIEVIQTPKQLSYKRTSLTDNSVKTLNFNYVTSSNFNIVNTVCLGDTSLDSCHNVQNTLDVVLRYEKQTVRSLTSLKSGRLIYYD